MVDFKKDTWLYILIAAIIAIIALLTPAAVYDTDKIYFFFSGTITYSADELMAQAVGTTGEWYGTGTATIWTLAIASMSIALLLWYGIHNMKGMEFKWDWLVYALIGIALIILPILMMVYDLEQQGIELDVSFAPILLLISGIIVIAATVIEKFGDRIFKGGAAAAGA